MAAFTAQLKPFSLLMVCVTFIVTLAALAASLHPAQAAAAPVPTAQAVPVAPAAHFASQTEAASGAVAGMPLPAPVPAAPGTPVAESKPSVGTASDVPITGSPLPLLGLAVAGGLLAVGALAQRQTGPGLRPAAC